MPVVEPHKELRFTRAHQAMPLWLLAATAAATAILLVSIGLHRAENPDLPHPAWATLPAVVTWASLRLAIHCTRHAYLILSPLGIEIFPLFRPARGMQLVHWFEIDHFEATRNRLILHSNPERTAGVCLTLRPIPSARRALLFQALQGRLSTAKNSVPTLK